MDTKVYDKAKWHFGNDNFPEELPIDNAYTHIAFFLRWCIENDFISKEVLKDSSAKIQKVKNGKLNCRQFFIDYFDGVFISEDLNSKGAKFANAYYCNGKTKFAKIHSGYLQDYSDWVELNENLTEQYGGLAYFYIQDTEDNYLSVKKIIDKRYSEYLEMTKNVHK